MEEHLIAVYGTLLSGEPNEYFMRNATLIQEDKVENFEMYSLGGFPGIMKGDGEISVEVYKVSAEDLIPVDRLEGHPTFYERIFAKTLSGLQVEIYEYKNIDRLSRCPKISSGNWREYRSKRSSAYYSN